MRIGMLGSFEVRTDDGGLADVPGARLRALLIALALEPGRVVGKATLVDWIWGEQPPADAANALHRLVSRLRKALPAGSVEGHTDGYRLAVPPEAVDAVRFERLVAAGRAGDALGLWRGPALQDVGLTDSAAFDAAVTRLEELRLSAQEQWYDAEARRGRGAELVTELSALVAAHPLRERLTVALMRALAAAGRQAEALLAYERTREALADALGADPSPELSALHVALLRGEGGPRKEERATNLRAELTSYVGKEADVDAVRDLIGGHRLTTLTGPGGTGKTRLATEAGRTLAGDVPDGVWLVELAPTGPGFSAPSGGPGAGGGRDSDVALATLGALRLRDPLLGEAPDAEPIDRVIAALRDREALLILDNCEHVIEAAAAFAHRVLGECRRLRILATSREPLGITGEALWPVVPLVLPDPAADPSKIEAAPAVRLLIDRASAVRPDLVTDAAALATMARICRALDGMPLAIELAAARLRTMTLDQLANRLDDRFRLLTGGSRTALPRHRTLRAVIDWSWGLITDAERTVLRRLSIFSGGASLEAAEQVCGGDDSAEVLDLLTALTEKSLVVAVGERYRMLGTIKEYAQQRLAEAGETEHARRAHLAYFTELAATAEPHLRRSEQLEWLAVLEAEHDNIAAAMRGALAAGEAGAAMRLAAEAGWYWWLGGHKTEGNELIMAAAALPGAVADETRAVVYAFVTMFLTSGHADQYKAQEWIHQAYELGRRIEGGHPAVRFIAALERMLRAPEEMLLAYEPLLADDDPWARALARLQMGKMRVMTGQDGAGTDAFLEAALAEFGALGERWGISFALSELAGRLATRGEFGAACARLDQACAVVTEVGAIEDVVPIRSRQAQLYWLAGDGPASVDAMAEAQRYAERVAWPASLAELALAKAELARWRGAAGEARRQVAAAAAMLGEEANSRALLEDLLGYLTEDLDESRRHRAAAFRAATEAGHAPTVARALVGVADLALRSADFAQAARLIAAARGVRGLRDLALPDEDRIDRETRDRLGAGYAEAVAEGERTGWDQLAGITLAS